MDRYFDNPILSPGNESWEKEGAFNGCVFPINDTVHMLYRAISSEVTIEGKRLELSTIGHALSHDRIHFVGRKQLIVPEESWEKFGCEDPRLTFLDGRWYVFYTALSAFPPNPEGIKVALAVSDTLDSIKEKHIVTPFNAKAMALFPEKIQGKMTAVLTVHTDVPPAKICLASFDHPQEIWDPNFWKAWYSDLDTHAIPLLRSLNDHVEVGAPPVLTGQGWLLVYCYIRNYLSSYKIFGVEAVLLDRDDPSKIIGRTNEPLFVPEKEYELYGKVQNVIFPTGVLIHNGDLGIYYGAADTTCCLAACNLNDLIASMRPSKYHSESIPVGRFMFKKYRHNPIVQPVPEHEWESVCAFNPAAVYEKGAVHIVYRAMGQDNTSVLGYASSRDGVHIDTRLPKPIYVPREPFEKKGAKNANSGCEDPRITRIDDRLYMCYTAYDSKGPTRVALTSIAVDDFCSHIWNWETPRLISPPGMNDKDACLFPKKINGKYAILHRLHASIWIDFTDDLVFGNGRFIRGSVLFDPRSDLWDNEKVGIGPPPLETEYGWLLIYHGMSKDDRKYRMGVALLDLDDPTKVLKRIPYTVLEPQSSYQIKGVRPGTVFACGMVVIGDELYLYYGAADSVISVASINLPSFLRSLAYE